MSNPVSSKIRLRIATTVWIAVLAGGLLLTDWIATLDRVAISAIVVLAAAAMFTAMQVIVREMSPASQGESRDVRNFRDRPIGLLALRNTGIVSIVFAVIWLTGVLPF